MNPYSAQRPEITSNPGKRSGNGGAFRQTPDGSNNPCKTINELKLCFTLLSFYFNSVFSFNISLVFHPMPLSLYVRNNVSSQGESTTNIQRPFIAYPCQKTSFSLTTTSFFFLFWPRKLKCVCQHQSLHVFLHGRNCFSHKSNIKMESIEQ